MNLMSTYSARVLLSFSQKIRRTSQDHTGIFRNTILMVDTNRISVTESGGLPGTSECLKFDIQGEENTIFIWFQWDLP